jgi:hypothetical protein
MLAFMLVDGILSKMGERIRKVKSWNWPKIMDGHGFRPLPSFKDPLRHQTPLNFCTYEHLPTWICSVLSMTDTTTAFL